jgi:hypothetical protein
MPGQRIPKLAASLAAVASIAATPPTSIDDQAEEHSFVEVLAVDPRDEPIFISHQNWGCAEN